MAYLCAVRGCTALARGLSSFCSRHARSDARVTDEKFKEVTKDDEGLRGIAGVAVHKKLKEQPIPLTVDLVIGILEEIRDQGGGHLQVWVDDPVHGGSPAVVVRDCAAIEESRDLPALPRRVVVYERMGRYDEDRGLV